CAVPGGRPPHAAPPATARADPRRRRATPLRAGPRPPSRCGSVSPCSNCLLDLRVRAAAAEVAGHAMANLLARRLLVRRDERDGADDLTGCAEAALNGVGAHERLDQRMLTEPFDRRHLTTTETACERDARERRLSVDEH